jgi:hypothetical protein
MWAGISAAVVAEGNAAWLPMRWWWEQDSNL